MRHNLRKIVFVFLVVYIYAGSACAYHIAGGDFTYRWLGGNFFEIKLTLYRDCSNPMGSNFDSTIVIGLFDKINDALVDTVVMTLGPTDSLTLSGNGCVTPPQVCLQKGEYVRVINIADNSGGYYLVWERCCRNITVTNISNPGFAAMAFYMEMPDPSLHNSSAQFNSPPTPFICVNQFFRFGFNATDADGDSLVYELSEPFDGGHTGQTNPNPFALGPNSSGYMDPLPGPYTTLTWAAGYDLTNICGSNIPLTINNHTGEIEVIPDFQGLFAMAVVVKEYRNGVLISAVRREIEITVIPCIGNSAPQLPTAITNNMQIQVNETDTISLIIDAHDLEGDSVYIIHYGDLFAGSGTLSITPPYAISHDTSGIDSASTTFTWLTGCNHGSALPYKVVYEAYDNGCPASLTDIGRIEITVNPQPLPDRSNLHCIDLINDSILSITRISDTNVVSRYFKHFVLYRSLNGSAFSPFAIINDLNPVLIYDSIAYANRDNDYCYVISAVNNCGDETAFSDTVCSISHINTHKNFIKSVSVTGENEITIKWEYFNDGPYAKYSIFKKSNDNNVQLTPYSYLTSYPAFEWKDEDVNTNKESYCYAMINEDVCGNESDTSLIACSILLKGEAGFYSNRLLWSPYINFKSNVDQYFIMRKPKEPGFYFDIAGSVKEGELVYFDRDLPHSSGIFNYYIKAMEGPGGNNESSYSNEIELSQNPLLYIPNAFSPNSDGTNDLFESKAAFIEEFELSIFNRWGQLVFNTTSINEHWNGNLNGKKAPMGVYFYKVRYKGYNNDIYDETQGSITLIR